HALGRAADRMNADARGARVEDSAKPIRAAVVEHRMALTANARPPDGRRYLADDQIDEVLDFGARHESPTSSSARIFARRRIYRGSFIDVVSHVVTIAFASSDERSVAPRVNTFAPLCSRE